MTVDETLDRIERKLDLLLRLAANSLPPTSELRAEILDALQAR